MCFSDLRAELGYVCVLQIWQQSEAFFARNDCLVSRSGAVNPKRRNYKKLKATKLEPTNYKPNTHDSVTNRND